MALALYSSAPPMPWLYYSLFGNLALLKVMCVFPVDESPADFLFSRFLKPIQGNPSDEFPWKGHLLLTIITGANEFTLLPTTQFLFCP